MATGSALMEQERTPLLASTGQTPANDSQYYASAPTSSAYSPATAPPVAGNSSPNDAWLYSFDDELPPPYNPSANGTVPTIRCKVCQALISLEGKINNHVVKCDQCNEATPIRFAPPGKKYVRCTCNCLLVCKTEARRVMCPRPACKKVIMFGQQSPRVPNDLTNTRIICVHCQQTFLFNLTNRALARCPHCRKISSIGRSYSLKRARIFLAIAFCFLIIAIIVTVMTCTSVPSHRGIIAAYVILFLCTIGCILRSLYYFSIRGSQIDLGS